jgi:sugar lactone lactonase YvrE
VGAAHVLMEGVVFGESPRWHDGRLWFSDWGANQVIALGTDGSHEVVVTVASFPMCIDFLPDGRLLVVDSAQRRLLRREPDGPLVTHADLSGVSAKPWKDIVVDDRGNAYVNTIGFDFPGGEFAPGLVVLATPDGTVRQVAGDVAFPNGMAITPDGGTLIVAESYASRLTAYDIGADGGLSNRRVWAETPATTQTGSASMPRALSGTPTWATSTACGCARAARCWPDRGAFACALSRGQDPRLFVVGQNFGGPGPAQPSGRVVVFPAPAPGAGKP